MRILSISAAVLFSISTSFASGTPASDPCRVKALQAAQEDYGLAPYRCTISTVSEGAKYKIYVGIGNPESGEHLYYVTFANGCNSDAVSEEAPEVAVNPLQDDAHTAYNKLVSFNTEVPTSNEVSASSLPTKAQKAYAANEKNFQLNTASWAKNGQDTSSLKISVFKIQVDGQDTFAVFTPNLNDSIREYFFVVDSKGNEIDSAAVYHESDVGTNGVSWQGETVQK